MCLLAAHPGPDIYLAAVGILVNLTSRRPTIRHDMACWNIQYLTSLIWPCLVAGKWLSAHDEPVSKASRGFGFLISKYGYGNVRPNYIGENVVANDAGELILTLMTPKPVQISQVNKLSFTHK